MMPKDVTDDKSLYGHNELVKWGLCAMVNYWKRYIQMRFLEILCILNQS